MPPTFDFSVKNDELKSDVVFLVGDREFHVNRTLLSIHSPVFSTMFSEKYKESTESRIPLEDVDADDFQLLLEVLYHKTDLTGEKASQILKLVDFFDLKDIKSQCEPVLMKCSDDEVDLKQKLLLADQYMLQELLKSSIEKITSVRQLQEVTPENVDDLNPKTAVMLLKKMVDLPKAPCNRPEKPHGYGLRSLKRNRDGPRHNEVADVGSSFGNIGEYEYEPPNYHWEPT